MTKSTQNQYFVVMTDTYGGEANYNWVNHFLVTASSARGAISKVTRETGYHARLKCDYGDMVKYNVLGACVCYFLQHSDGEELKKYPKIKTL